MLDLEDAVAVGDKDAARVAVGDFLSTGVQVLVRVNGTDTSWCADDLQMLAQWKCAVMVPKAHSASQLQSIAEQLAPGGTPLVALIETAAGVNATEAICAVDTVVRAAFGSIDLGAELGVDPPDLHQALQYARSAVVLGSAAAERAAPPLDGVTTELGDMGMLSDDISHAVRLGFGGKLCIHPRQVAAVNQRFAPSPEELDWARKVVDEAVGGEVCVVDGKMVDKPVLARAERILLRAR